MAKKIKDVLKGERFPESGKQRSFFDDNEEIKNNYRNLIKTNFPRFMEELNKMHGEKYVRAFLDASKFVIPTMAATRLEDDTTVNNTMNLIRRIAGERQQAMIATDAEVIEEANN